MQEHGQDLSTYTITIHPKYVNISGNNKLHTNKPQIAII